MDLSQLRAFMHALGVNNVTHASGAWAQCSCPLAPFKHRAGRDSNPSFGVALDEPVYNCFVCGAGGLAQLVGEIELHLSRHPDLKPRFDIKTARALLHADANTVVPLPPYAEFTPGAYAEFEQWPEYVLEQFLPAWSVDRARDYLSRRGVGEVTTGHFELRYDSTKDMVVAPYRTAEGKLAGLRGRLVVMPGEDPGSKLIHFDYTWNKVNNIGMVWYHEQTFNLPGPLIIVEGQFDCMRVWRYHRKVAAILSATASEYKKKKLVGAASVVAVMLDNDHTGKLQTFGDETRPGWLSYLASLGINSFAVDYPDPSVKDPGSAGSAWLAAVAKELESL